MIDPKEYCGCIHDEDGYFYENCEGADYPVNPFGESEEGDDEE